MNRRQRFPACTAFLIFFFTLPTLAAAAAWSTTDWAVDCYVPSCLEWYGEQGPCQSAETQSDYQEYVQYVSSVVEQEWGGEAECRDEAGSATRLSAELLREASVWLAQQGFNEPLLPKTKDKKKFRAFVIPPHSTVRIVGAEVSQRSAYAYRGPLPEENVMLISGVDQTDAAHELFHAVQHNSTAWKKHGHSVPAWIEEGTAQAVGLTFASSSESGKRPYDEILNWTPTDQTLTYEDQYFWREIGKRIGVESHISYLKGLLDGDPGTERDVAWVDSYLHSHKGLYELAPYFFAKLDIDTQFTLPGTGGSRRYFGDPPDYKAELPSGQTRKTHRLPKTKATKVAGRSGKIKASHSSDKPVEVEISFVSDDDALHLIVNNDRFDAEGTNRNLYRDLLVHQNKKEYDIIVANVAQEAAASKDLDYQLQVKLREVGYCSMTARVTGDISSSHFGDIAHFSTTGGATGYGVASNPEMIEGMLDWAADMADAIGGEGAGKENETPKQEWMAETSDLPRETFGLSLTDQKLDAEGEEAFAFIAGGFSLEASVIGTELAEKVTGRLPIKILRVVPGPRAESTLDKVPFVWVEGAPGSAQLTLTRNTGDLVAGHISGTLYSEGYYKADGSPAVIHLQASFVALPGPMGCLPGGLGMY